jgi:ribosomal protein S18 acetylase RimI-like enzyme
VDIKSVEIRTLTPELAEDYLNFFDQRAFSDNPDWSGCYCYFPYHDPAHGPWSQRSATDNRDAISQAIASGQASGFLAYDGDRVVGWCNANRRSSYPQLRNLPGDGESTGATPCFIVDPACRGMGIASRLLAAAAERFTDQGVVKMEAGPNGKAKTSAQNSRGPLSMYVNFGYQVVGEFPDGTVVVEKYLSN